ncbi:MAG: hypothetical protein JW731_03495 [Bacteroidales bacterium]|nr:hypothetical protein [Bacteroidales bacterium]
MRKLSYLTGLILLTGLVFTSCNKDENEEPQNVNPTMNFKGGTHTPTGMEYVDGDITLSTNETFVVGITASSNSGKNLTNLNITRKFENGAPFYADTTFNATNFNYDFFFLANNEVGNEDWIFTMEDKDGNKTQLSFTITTEAIPAGIVEYTDIELGSIDSPTESSFASITGETFLITEAANDATIQEKIDFVYFDGATYGQTIVSPDDDLAAQVYSSISNWTTRNATLFSRTQLNAAAYDQIINAFSLLAVTQQLDFDVKFISELKPEPAEGFAVGDVFAFQTATGLFGLIKVTEVNQGATDGLSTIKYDVKVQD